MENRSKSFIGEKINEKKLKKIGNKGILAMICDSTNVFSPGRAGSESDVRKSLLKIMENKKKNNSNFFCFKCSKNGKYFLLC